MEFAGEHPVLIVIVQHFLAGSLILEMDVAVFYFGLELKVLDCFDEIFSFFPEFLYFLLNLLAS